MSPADCFWTLIKLRKAKKRAWTNEKIREHSSTKNLSDGGTRSLEHIAATRIQTAFRAFVARKKGCNGVKRRLATFPVRIQELIEGDIMGRKQALIALSYIDSWSKIQQEIGFRRLFMVTEDRLRQKRVQNHLKLEAKLHEIEVEWCSGTETMEEILSRIRQKEEAGVRRERAMAYAFSHQWRANSILQLGPAATMSIDKENWGWSWKERWIAARPWEVRARDHPTVPKKVQTKLLHGSKMDKRNHIQPELKTASSSASAKKLALSNGKGTIKHKTRSCALSNA